MEIVFVEWPVPEALEFWLVIGLQAYDRMVEFEDDFYKRCDDSKVAFRGRHVNHYVTGQLLHTNTCRKQFNGCSTAGTSDMVAAERFTGDLIVSQWLMEIACS